MTPPLSLAPSAAMAHPPDDIRSVREVWAWNLDAEFEALLGAVCGEAGTILAFDTEFPGFLREEPASVSRAVQYQALRENVDLLQPIQLGLAVSSPSGILRGIWSFNILFDIAVDLHTEASVIFLTAAGIDFPRHAIEGIDATVLGMKLGSSLLVGCHASSPWWVTFSGSYDLGYLLKLLTGGPLPCELSAFDAALAAFCPRRHEIRDQLPHGSLESLVKQRGIQRSGVAHTAGSDALATLELFQFAVSLEDRAAANDGTAAAAAMAYQSGEAAFSYEPMQHYLTPMPLKRPISWLGAAAAAFQGEMWAAQLAAAQQSTLGNVPIGHYSDAWEAAALEAYLSRSTGLMGAGLYASSSSHGAPLVDAAPPCVPASSWGDAARWAMQGESSGFSYQTPSLNPSGFAVPPDLWGQAARQAWLRSARQANGHHHREEPSADVKETLGAPEHAEKKVVLPDLWGQAARQAARQAWLRNARQAALQAESHSTAVFTPTVRTLPPATVMSVI